MHLGAQTCVLDSYNIMDVISIDLLCLTILADLRYIWVNLGRGYVLDSNDLQCLPNTS